MDEQESILDYGFKFQDLAAVLKDSDTKPTEELPDNVKQEENSLEESKPVKEAIKDLEPGKDNQIQEPTSEWGRLLKVITDKKVLDYDPETEYSEDEESVIALINENLKKKQESAIDEYKKSLNPESLALLEHINKGLSVEDYISIKSNVIDYEAIDINILDTTDKRNIIGLLLEKQGLNEEAIESQLSAFEASNTLDLMAENAKKSLSILQDNEIKAKEEQKLLEIENKKVAQKVQEEQFKQTVTSLRELQGIKLTENDANQLYDYITKPVGKNNESQLKLDDDEKSRLFYAFLKMKKFNFKSLEEKAENRIGLKFKKSLDTSKTLGSSNSTSVNTVAERNSVVDQQTLFNTIKSFSKL